MHWYRWLRAVSFMALCALSNNFLSCNLVRGAGYSLRPFPLMQLGSQRGVLLRAPSPPPRAAALCDSLSSHHVLIFQSNVLYTISHFCFCFLRFPPKYQHSHLLQTSSFQTVSTSLVFTTPFETVLLSPSS